MKQNRIFEAQLSHSIYSEGTEREKVLQQLQEEVNQFQLAHPDATVTWLQSSAYEYSQLTAIVSYDKSP